MRRIEAVGSANDCYDLVVVGAGPAGLAAAAAASHLGLATLIADENPTPGGQIYRAVTTTPVQRRDVLGPAYWEGRALADELEASECDYAPQTTIWSAEPSRDEDGNLLLPPLFDVGLSRNGRARIVRARRLVLATGALERPFPVPGWTLPGVLTAGAAQIALKSSGLVPQGRTVLAGSGPLLLLLADQLKRAGVEIVAALDTTPATNRREAWPHLVDFLRSPYAAYGLKLFAKAQVSLPIRSHVESLRIEGEDKVQRISFTRRGRQQSLECDQVLLHQGVIPNVNMPNALGCAQHWDEHARAWTPSVDQWMQSSLPGIAIAGDGAGIAGAQSAALRGRIAATAAAFETGHLDEAGRNRLAVPLFEESARYARGRRFIDALYRPAPSLLLPPDPSTIVCRCEEVRAGQIRDTVRQLHVEGPNQLKAYLRNGMGPCQGRLCGSTVIELIAEARGVPVEDVGYYRLRTPVKPITLAEIASMPQSQAAKNAVMR